MISRVFPKTHPKAGMPTNFAPKILSVCGADVPYQAAGQNLILDTKAYYADYCFTQGFGPKRHTIRLNYELWKKRADKINAGEAVLSLRQWSGEPYKSKQVEFMQLEKIGIQYCEVWSIPLSGGVVAKAVRVDDRITGIDSVAKNDGLSVDDFCKWFKKDMQGCVIHFTDFRYGNS